LGAIIADRLWLAGHGRVKITSNGNRLRATLVDTSVWQAERLCFTRADCRDGVEHRFPPPNHFPGECDDLVGESWLADLPPLTEPERARLALLQGQALAAAEPDARAARESWVDEQLERRAKLAKSRGETIDRDLVRASLLQGEQMLPADLVLYPVGAEPITAGQMFKEGAKWDGIRLADPFEPGYGDDPRIALVVFNCAEPHIFSHAHGGQRYLFRSESERDAEVAADFKDLGPLPEADRVRRRFEAIPAGEFIKGPAPTWLVKGVLPEATLCVVYGASGSGKTFFVLDLVAAVARGEPWRGQRVKQRTVAYVCAEGAAGFRNRVRAYAQQHAADFGTRLLVISQPPNLLAGADAKALTDDLAFAGAQLVVIDTFAQVTPGADENSGADVGKALKVCRDIHAATGAPVVLVHHSGKDASRGARGWSGMRAAADAEIEVTKNDREHAATITKMKDGEEGSVFGFRLLPILLGHDEDGDEITSCVVSPCEVAPPTPTIRRGPNQRAVLGALHDLLPFSADGVAIEDVLARAFYAVPSDPEKSTRDRRREHVAGALRELKRQGEITEANGILRAANMDFSRQEGEEKTDER